MGTRLARNIIVYPGLLEKEMGRVTRNVEFDSDRSLIDVANQLQIDDKVIGFFALDGTMVNIEQAQEVNIGDALKIEIFPILQGG